MNILSLYPKTKQDNIILAIKASLKSLAEYEKKSQHLGFGDWQERFLKETSKLVNEDLTIKVDNLINFRGKQIFVKDCPSAYLKSFYNSSKFYYSLKKVINRIWGNARGKVKETLDSFKELEKMNFLYLLKKYPVSSIGNPLILKYKDYSFTNRHLRHIYLLGLFKQYLEERLEKDSVILDIGSSYGIFSSLVKREMPKSHHILVDMPGQLILAHYYLAKLLPQAKIAGFKEVTEAKTIDRNFIRRFDFVLLPTSVYTKLALYSADLITNFLSFSEMSREWFDLYMQSKPFMTTPFFYTINRYDSYLTYNNDITILNYPLKDYEEIYMRTCPLFKYYYEGFLFFWHKAVRYSSEVFQFIGKRKNM